MLKTFTPLAFILLWIVPVGWVGLMRSNYPLYPNWIAPLFRVTGIFESSPRRWRTFFIEAQDRKTGDWHYMDEKSLFAPTPLGNRTRFQQLMNTIEDSNSPEEASRLLSWIVSHLSEAGHSLSQINAVRIFHVGVPSETFLQCASLADVYKTASETNLPRVIVASQTVELSSHENP